MKPRVLILHATGTNRDLDAAQAIELVDGTAEIVHINHLHRNGVNWSAYQMLVLPGGFSYADALGAGKLLAIDLQSYFSDQVQAFVDSGKPVIGICNGFQVLVKAGVLPGRADLKATLTFNQAGHFECRWVSLLPRSQVCVWTRGLSEAIECPVAHGEGNFVLEDPQQLAQLQLSDQIALVYSDGQHTAAAGTYPENPNGSIGDIAGLCNLKGNVLGLMPHPEDHIFSFQHPRWTRGEQNGLGLALFENGIRYAEELG
jgi:phosphoribosylformylglycinamidine synthase subunit PurQ / glutaminase